jgi:excisionase family DNA binding protein
MLSISFGRKVQPTKNTKMAVNPRPRDEVAPSCFTNFHTITEVAGHCRVSVRTARRWVATGAIAVHRFGRRVAIADDDLRAFIAAHRAGVTTKGTVNDKR